MAKTLAETFIQVVVDSDKKLTEAEMASGEKHFAEDKRACLRALQDITKLITKAKLSDLVYRPDGLERILDDLDAVLDSLQAHGVTSD
jgi:hypothetical protein